MNYNLVRLGQINDLLDELIYIDLKFNTGILSQIINLFFEIKSHIDFMITEFYFTSIIEFETKKNQILYKLIFIKNKFITFHLDNHIIEKVNYVKNMLKQVFYPAYLNANNIKKYKQEIKQTKIKFYHKSGTMNENFYDEEIVLEDDEIPNIKIKSHNNQNCVINKIKGKKFLSNIDFSKSYINI